MYLKKIIISGFKSFVNKVTIDLTCGDLSGVVGPNGSGKSNIIDAVRWVMGEQSNKNLRGYEACDLIFNGSSLYKPLSRAEVRLVFDNSQVSEFCPVEYRFYQEIIITRTIFRDGTKEVFINDKKVRLKALSDFFSSVGLSCRNFAIIQQGQIAQILQNKPEKLYELIERTCGIMHYKKKKSLSLEKLTKSKQDLDSVELTIESLKKQIDYLSAQSQAADEYKKIQSDIIRQEQTLISYDVMIINGKLDDLQKTKKDLEQKIKDCEYELNNTKTKKSIIERELADQKSNIYNLNKTLTDLKQQLAADQAHLSSTAKAISKSQELCQQIKITLSDDESSKNKFKTKLTSLDTDITSCKKSLQNINQNILDFNKNNENLFHTQALIEKIKKLEKELQKNHKSLTENKIYLNDRQKKLTHCISEISDYSNKLDAMNIDINKLTIDIESLDLNSKNFCQSLQQCSTYKQKKQDEILQISYDLKSLNDQLSQLNILSTQLSTKKRLFLKQLSDIELKNDPNNFKKLLLEKQKQLNSNDDFKKLLPKIDLMFLSDNIILTDYGDKNLKLGVKKLINSWFSSLWLTFALNDEKKDIKLKECLNYLDKLSYGFNDKVDEFKLGMSVITKTNNSQITTDKQNVFSCLKALYPQYITINPQKTLNDAQKDHIKRLVSSMFYLDVNDYKGDFFNINIKINPISLSDKVIFCSDNAVIEWSKLYKKTFSLEFKLFDEIKVIDNKLASLDKQLSSLKNQLSDKNQIKKKLEAEIKKISLQEQEINAKVIEHNYKLTSSKEKLNRFRQQKAKYSKFLQDLFCKKTALDKKISDVNNTIIDLSQSDNKLSKQLESDKKRQLDSFGLISQLTAKKNQLILSKSKATTKLVSLQESYNEIKEYLNDIDIKITSRNENLLKQIDYKKELIEQKNRLRSCSKDILEKIASLEKQLQNNSDKLSEKTSVYNDYLASEIKLSALRQKLAKNINDNAIEATKCITQKEHIKKLLFEQYKLTEVSEFTHDKNTFNRDDYFNNLVQLKKSLDSVGEINFAAYAQKENKKTEYEFLSDQKKQLEDSINALHVAIDEIDQISTKKFAIAFNKLNHHFKEIFPKLFSEGSGHLQLVSVSNEPNDLIDSNTADKKQHNILVKNNNNKSLKSNARTIHGATVDENQEFNYNNYKDYNGVEILIKMPHKRYQPLSLLSGGEQALSAIALIFSFLNANPVPFCLLDEVDAPLDEANITKYCDILLRYKSKFQFIVITHNRMTMECFDRLYGVTMHNDGVSKLVMLDLEKSLPAYLKKDSKISSRSQNITTF